MTYYVYELFDPRSGVVFYVGKGKGRRIDCHEQEAAKGKKSRKCDRIREIVASGQAIGKRKVELFEDENEAYVFEYETICRHGPANLTNEAIYCQSAAERVARIKDSEWVSATANLINRTKDGEIIGVYIMGKLLDLRPILASYKERTSEIIARLGLDTVNGWAAKYRVRFEHAEA